MTALFEFRAVRYVIAVVFWPVAYIADRLAGVDPPASFRAGLAFAAKGRPLFRSSSR